MKYQEIIKELAFGKNIEIGNGEYIINKKIREVIGGVPIYDIQVTSFLNDSVKTFKSLDEFDYKYLSDMENKDLKRCSKCGEIKYNDYYINYENGCTYCSISCLIDGMDSLYGKGEWQLAFNAHKDIDLSKGFILVKGESFDDETVIINGESWRYLDLHWIHYDFNDDFDFDELTMEEIFEGQETDI